jgi:hypothetical protein
MYVSAETLAIVISAIGLVLTFGASIFGAGAWLVRRIDEVETRLSTKIDTVEEKLTQRINEVEQSLRVTSSNLEHSLRESIAVLACETNDVKIAVARLEGPPRHLILAQR